MDFDSQYNQFVLCRVLFGICDKSNDLRTNFTEKEFIIPILHICALNIISAKHFSFDHKRRTTFVSLSIDDLVRGE